MACTCTEDKEVIGNVIIGRNRVICQECLDSAELERKNRAKQTLLAELKDLESRIYYSQLDGATEFVASKMEQRAILKAKLVELN
jgi:hypothetical protein